MSKVSGKIIQAAVCCSLALMGGGARGQFDGDSQLLQRVLDARAENRRHLQTWQGRASIQTVTRSAGVVTDSRTADATFVVDAANNKARWSWTYTNVAIIENGQPVDTAEMLAMWDNTIRIKTDDLYLRYEPGGYKEVEGVRRAVRTLGICPGNAPEAKINGFAEDFDPRWYMSRTGLDIDHYFTFLLSLKDQASQDIHLSQEGTRIVVGMKNGSHPPSRWEFDLEQGGNLVLDTGYVDNDVARFEYSLKLISGAWVPVAFHYRKTDEARKEVTLSRDVTFGDVQVNEPVDARVFTIDGLNLERGTSVSDQRVGLSYRYGVPADDAKSDHALDVASTMPSRESEPKEIAVAGGVISDHQGTPHSLGALVGSIVAGVMVLGAVVYWLMRRHRARNQL